MEIVQALAHVSQPLGDEILDFLTGLGVAVAKREKRGDVIECKARRLGRADEAQSFKLGLAVGPIVAGTGACRWS